MALPAFYHRLAPFRPEIDSDLAIVCYHKLGPKPSGVRLGGLYVSADLFDSQLAELRAADFATPPFTDIVNGPRPPRTIALTFDDGFRNVLRYGLPALERHRFRAIQFIIPGLIGKTNEWEEAIGEAREPLMDTSEIRAWLEAGHEIGSHSSTHPRLTKIPLAQAREEITASKKKLEDTFGRVIEHFCYPYGDWNEAVADLVREAGYLSACTSNYGTVTDTTPRHALTRFQARRPSRRLSYWIWQLTGYAGSSRKLARSIFGGR